MGKAKLVYLAKRNATIAKQDFPDRWRQHSALPREDPDRVLEVSAVTYAMIEAVACGVADDEYDAIGLVDLAGLQSIPAAAKALSARGEIAADELLTFDDYIEPCTVFCSVDVLRAGQIGGAGLIQFARRRAGVRPTAFVDAWRQAALADLSHAGLATQVRCFIQNVVVAPPPVARAYDGVQEIWFDDREAAIAAAQAMRDDPALVDEAASPVFLTTTVMHRATTPGGAA